MSETWVSLRHAKLPRHEVIGRAARDGYLLAAEFADVTDRVLLLSRDPRNALTPRRRFRMSMLGFIAPAVWVVLGLTVVALLDRRWAGVAFCLIAPGAFAAAWVLRVFPRPLRLKWLAREFTGKPGVTFFPGQFGVSPALTGQIAAAHGYAFGSATRTRAQGALVTYVRFR